MARKKSAIRAGGAKQHTRNVDRSTGKSNDGRHDIGHVQMRAMPQTQTGIPHRQPNLNHDCKDRTEIDRAEVDNKVVVVSYRCDDCGEIKRLYKNTDYEEKR
jgi:hypothetical protein